MQDLAGEDHRGDPALHVARAPTVEHVVSDFGRERVARPSLKRLRRNGVDVTVQEQRLPASDTGKARNKLRPPLEAQPGRYEWPTLNLFRRWLPEVDLSTGDAKPVCEVGLQRRLVPGWVVGVPRRRVEADERRGEFDELVSALRDRVADHSLALAQAHGTR